MNNYTKLLNNLSTLKLLKMREELDEYIDLINNNKKDVVDALYELTNLEIDIMNEKKNKSLYTICRISILQNIRRF